MVRQQQHILRPLAEGGQCEGHDIQAIEQVFAETAGPHFGLEVAVGRGDQSNIRLSLSCFAKSFVRAVIEEPQKTRLRIRREVADFIEEQRSALAFLDLPGHVRHRAGERALAVPEERTRHQVA